MAELVTVQRYITKYMKKQGFFTVQFHTWMHKFAIQGSLLFSIGRYTKY